jgi:23S rRNA pseudouridine1911/1915/1917 synthase
MTDPAPLRLKASVSPEFDGERLDRFLSRRFPDVSRTRFQDLIAKGGVAVEGEACHEARRRIKAGEQVEVELPWAGPAEPRAETIPLNVVYEDGDLIVIDKPAGMVVHPAAGHESGTLVNALIAHCGDSLSGVGGVRRPGIVHRLDKDTSGLLVAAKNDQAHRGLAEQFAAHGRDGRLKREYLALVWGVPERRSGMISAPLGRSSADRKKIAVSKGNNGRQAITRYQVVETFGKPPLVSLLRCRLETGRTHQIRVHMAHIGHPLVGDPLYGKGFSASAAKLPETARSAFASLGRQALHAVLLGFEHPTSHITLLFESELPPDIAILREKLRGAPLPQGRNQIN